MFQHLWRKNRQIKYCGQAQVALNPDLIGDLPLHWIDSCRGNPCGCPVGRTYYPTIEHLVGTGFLTCTYINHK